MWIFNCWQADGIQPNMNGYLLMVILERSAFQIMHRSVTYSLADNLWSVDRLLTNCDWLNSCYKQLLKVLRQIIFVQSAKCCGNLLDRWTILGVTTQFEIDSATINDIYARKMIFSNKPFIRINCVVAIEQC